MKKIKKYFCFIIILSVFSINSSAEKFKGSGKPLQFEPPGIKSFDMKNGIKVFYIQDELPQLTIIVSACFGSLYEDNKNAGLSELLAHTLSNSGSKNYPGKKLHEAVESIGGRLSISASWENVVISIRVLQRYSERAFSIIEDLLRNPEFSSGQMENARALLIEKIKRKNDEPAGLAFEKIREVIFDSRSYGSVMSRESLKSISLKDIKDAWDIYFKGGNLIFGFSTSMDFEEIRKSCVDSFSNIEKGDRREYKIDYPAVMESIKEKSGKIYLITKDVPQATIVLGTLAPDISSGDVYSLRIMNYILGGGSFNSRLMKEIRVKRGLSYAVQSIMRFRKNAGLFLAYAQTNNEKAPLTLSLLLENINKISREKVTPDELKLAQESIENSYVFKFDTSGSILQEYISLYYNGLPESYLENYLKNISRVDSKDILQKTNELCSSGLVKVVVGRKDLKAELEKFGQVVILDKD